MGSAPHRENYVRGILIRTEWTILTGIARLVDVFDLNLTTQILIFPC